MRSKISRQGEGFTLLEMVVVLVLMAIIASASVLSLQQPLQRARLKRVRTNLEEADRRARSEAIKRSEVVELTFDGRKGTVTQMIRGDYERRKSSRSLALSGGLRIDQFVTEGQTSNEDRFTVRFSPNGQSETYAIRLRGAENLQAWFVVVGATGQYVQSNEDSVVETIVSLQR